MAPLLISRSREASGARDRRLAMLDLGEALPEWLVEIADSELDAQRPCALIGWVEVLVPRHPGRHVDGVAGLPVVVLVVDLGEPDPLEHVEHRLGMRVA